MTVALSTPSRVVNALRLGRNRDDCSDVQVAVRPSIQSLANPRENESSTVEWHSAHWMPTALSRVHPLREEAGDPHHGVGLQQGKGVGRILQVRFSGLDCVSDGFRHRRFHCQTAGVTLTAQQPHNNVVRGGLSGAWPPCSAAPSRSTPTRSTRRSRSRPRSRSASRSAPSRSWRTRPGVPNVVDPLGGSYYVEALTDALEREAEGLFAEIEAQGGVVRAIETGWFQRQIAALVDAVPGGGGAGPANDRRPQ